eukprot:gnl/TRDRNA2_/TRDRNA2_133069_c0_seq1.p1 gnl/TRDRNA2_/TRDRNA2_133069_c0~~gnl/TRDRNA2_/TRDRNA2_133069_c0_seq1.p1  ORF type:complete len:168 (+),score=22.51 gnl/TRDRNA2_/TRDRNA2_133069_c0_seq1:156-659(+)
MRDFGLIPGKQLWLYDAWRGLPEIRAEDGQFASLHVGWGWDASPGAVARLLRNAGFNISRDTVFRKGWFNETFKLPRPPQVSFLHVDGDWYQSVLDTLETFYDDVSVGGIILLDDFGYWEGARLAFFDFCASRRLAPVVERMGSSQLYFVKGKEHNRGSRPLTRAVQ